MIKKASELSILCDAEVAVITLSADGELHGYSSANMEHTLERYNNAACRISARKTRSLSEELTHEPETQELQERHEQLRLEKLRRMGKELEGVSSEEMSILLEQQTKGLLAVQSKKVELLEEKLQRSRSREEQTMHENESLRRRIGFMMRRNYRPYILPCHTANYLDRNYGNMMRFCTSSRAAAAASNNSSEETADNLDMTKLRLWP